MGESKAIMDEETLLSLWLDDELDPDAQAELERAFDSDPAQKKHFEQLSVTVRALRSLPAEDAPGDFLRGVQSRIRRRSRGRHYGHKVRYRFPYEAVFNGVLLGILFAVYLIAMPAPVNVPPPVDPAVFQAGGAPASVGIAVLGQYGDVTVDANSDAGDFVVYRVDVAQSRLGALMGELSLYPELVLVGDPVDADKPGFSVVRVRAPR